MALGLAANFWNFAAKTWGLAANACTNAMLDHSCLQLDIDLSYLSYSTPKLPELDIDLSYLI
jgi:hypothetical protein